MNNKKKINLKSLQIKSKSINFWLMFNDLLSFFFCFTVFPKLGDFFSYASKYAYVYDVVYLRDVRAWILCF